MAVKKATTTSDIKRNEQQVANDDQLTRVTELTDPSVVENVEQPKLVRVTSPSGATTLVPEGILEALLDSGYTK